VGSLKLALYTQLCSNSMAEVELPEIVTMVLFGAVDLYEYRVLDLKKLQLAFI